MTSGPSVTNVGQVSPETAVARLARWGVAERLENEGYDRFLPASA
jgi:hypothetical protein